MKASFSSRKNKYLFGSTSAIITDLALIVGLANSVNAKTNILAGIKAVQIKAIFHAYPLKLLAFWTSFDRFSSQVSFSLFYEIHYAVQNKDVR